MVEGMRRRSFRVHVRGGNAICVTQQGNDLYRVGDVSLHGVRLVGGRALPAHEALAATRITVDVQLDNLRLGGGGAAEERLTRDLQREAGQGEAAGEVDGLGHDARPTRPSRLA